MLKISLKYSKYFWNYGCLNEVTVVIQIIMTSYNNSFSLQMCNISEITCFLTDKLARGSTDETLKNVIKRLKIKVCCDNR